MFKEEREELQFDWSMIGNIGEGRPNLGNTMDVSVYRLMQFTLRDVLIKEFDAESADRIFYEAGKQAGQEFCKELIGVPQRGGQGRGRNHTSFDTILRNAPFPASCKHQPFNNGMNSPIIYST